jgi:hypothetical protein
MFTKIIFAIPLIIYSSTLNASSYSYTEQPENDALYKRAVQLRKTGRLSEAKECFNSLLFSNSPDLVRKSMHNLGTISHTQKLYDESACWFSSATAFSLDKLQEPFKPSLSNLDALRKLGLVSQDVSFVGDDSGSINWNWSRQFILKNGNTINHRCNRIEVREGYGDTSKNQKLPTVTITEQILSFPGSLSMGVKLENLLFLSYDMTEAAFEKALRDAGLYAGENHEALFAHIKKFSFSLAK